MVRILPFAALRTLESVVRNHGFGRAAEELNVTQSAVSQHIKAIEEWTGHKLLIRGPRQTVATEQGVLLANAVAEGFGTIEAVCDQLRDKRSKHNRGVLLASPPGFAFVWLLPRLLNFDTLFPDIPVSLNTNVFSRDFNAANSDVEIHYGLGGFPGLHAEQLMHETMSPVCAPELAPHLRDLSDLSEHTILLDDILNIGNPPTWEFWAKETSTKLPSLPRRRKLGQANMVVQAAIKGQGVAMGRSPLVCDAIADGTLVQPFQQVARSQFSYWFVCTHDALKSKPIRAFRDWLFEEVARQPQIHPPIS